LQHKQLTAATVSFTPKFVLRSLEIIVKGFVSLGGNYYTMLLQQRRQEKPLRTIILEHAAATVIDNFSARYEHFDEVYRQVEAVLASKAEVVGIKGLFVYDIGLGYYMHLSAHFMPIDVLYRYDAENVYIETLTVESILRKAS
jgi:hypothetical protein